ncbi:PAS domain-containing protein [Phenylobacterium soli]|uniref:PAS domain-containing protein n=1 Tax=Phenylobacterium soli TaxID=2170551 RepID=A0A328ANJ8_9CAUL|nr:PAS domain-containing protein [Phenylobacterium soli]RAK54418.1 hypothetical protein DJ017_07720 [Phenylobacterium soli]
MNTVESSRELAWIRERLARPLPLAEDTAVIATTLQGQVAVWNRAAERLYGWSEAEALGRDILELTPAKYTREQSAEIMQALQAGETWEGEILLRRRSGDPVVAFVLDVPVGDVAGGQGAIVGVSSPAETGAAIREQAAEISATVRRWFEHP